MSDRIEQIHLWLKPIIKQDDYSFAPASSDASFRRYFRIQYDGRSQIVMDAPPEQENSEKFITIANQMASFGLNVPIISASDLDKGFLLISDLGNREYLYELNADTVERLYGDALSSLVVLQTQGIDFDLPHYDRALLMREMEIFREWYLGKHINYELDDKLNKEIDSCFEFLAQSALEQDKVIVHRDYHSRNLLITEENNPGILDFQDAVIGPVTYDLVSLLRDCYVQWPIDLVRQWVIAYHNRCLQSGILKDVSEQQFIRWFDLMGIQRHLKASGIFARLNYRDNKPDYLKDIPRTLNYVKQASKTYPELEPISILLDKVE